AAHDPRRPAARVCRPRPRVPAVGGRRAALARAGARRAGVPPASAQRLGAARAPAARARRALRGARPRRDAHGEDADPARAAPPRGGCGRRAARDRHLAGAAPVSGIFVWLVVALGLGVVVVRRRSLAVGLVTTQALVLAVSAVHSRAGAAAALAVRAVALATLLLLVVSRTREPRPVRAGVAPLARGGVAVGFALALTWLVPTIGLESRNVERGVLALVAFGVAAAATRHATLFHVL